MTAIEFPDLLRFFVQASLAVSGAAALWSIVLRQRAKHASANQLESYKGLTGFVAKVFFVGITLFLLLWWFAALFVFLPQGMAHEGIKVDHTIEEIVRGYQQNIPALVVMTLFALGGVAVWIKRRLLFEKYAQTFFVAQFVLLTLITIVAAWEGLFSSRMISSFLHNWHSFLTLGTVVTVDLLYLSTLHKHHLQKIVYPFFPLMSATIWVGLGLDFLSAGLVFEEGLRLTPQFYFVQTVIAIIIINGSLLSGRVSEELLQIARAALPTKLSPRLQYLFGLSGAVSIVSWTTITFVDFFEFPFLYVQFLMLYVAAIVLAYVGHFALEKLFEPRAARGIMSE